MADEGIKVTSYQDERNITESYISCEISYKLLLPPVVYNLLLGIACAYHAFKTRKLPDNFNESKFIGMTVYTTVIMWVAFIPAYMSINSRYYKIVPLSIALLINAVFTTCCLFVPRLYALRWVERGRMNLRTLSVSLQSISDKARRASVPDVSSGEKQRSMSSDSTRHIMSASTPDVISTVYSNHKVQGDLNASTSDSTSTVLYHSNADISAVVLQDLSSSTSTDQEYEQVAC